MTLCTRVHTTGQLGPAGLFCQIHLRTGLVIRPVGHSLEQASAKADVYTPDSKGKGTLTSGDNELARSLLTVAHGQRVKAIASSGGSDSVAAFRSANAAGVIGGFVKRIVALLDDPGYDGIDADWEPLDHADELVAIDPANRILPKVATACSPALAE